MNKLRAWWVPLLLILVIGGLSWAALTRRPVAQVQASLIGATPEPVTGRFERAEGPRPLVFPLDHGPHPDFQTEWWYYTGNLQTSDGRRFGYQLTFFRRALQPAESRPNRTSNWAAEQVYLAHFTLTDVTSEQFHAFERLERGAAGLAGAQGQPAYQVWLRDWSVRQTAENTYQLHAEQDDFSLDLTLLDRKGNILQGEQGYSQKGPEPGNASLYYSQTRLESQGTINLGGQPFEVSGLSWLDREISTSVLSQDEIGWDWFSLQLDDGSELMVYIIRRVDGSISRFSGGTLIRPDGSTLHFNNDDIKISAEATWKSPHSQGVYPSRWQISIPAAQLKLIVEPLLADQELNLSFTYWEGSVSATGAHEGAAVSGYGYVELIGYAQSAEGQFLR